MPLHRPDAEKHRPAPPPDRRDYPEPRSHHPPHRRPEPSPKADDPPRIEPHAAQNTILGRGTLLGTYQPGNNRGVSPFQLLRQQKKSNNLTPPVTRLGIRSVHAAYEVSRYQVRNADLPQAPRVPTLPRTMATSSSTYSPALSRSTSMFGGAFLIYGC